MFWGSSVGKFSLFNADEIGIGRSDGTVNLLVRDMWFGGYLVDFMMRPFVWILGRGLGSASVVKILLPV